MNKKIFFKSALQAFSFLAILAFLTQTGLATTAKLATDEQLVLSSRLIVTGNVESIQSQWDTKRRNIYTYVTVRVSEVLKGQIRNEVIVIKQDGGIVGEDEIRIDGAPRFQTGQRVLLFLDTLSDGALTVKYLFQGKYDIVDDAATGRLMVERRFYDGDNLHLLPGEDALTTNRAEFSAFVEKIQSTLRSGVKERSLRGATVREAPSEYRSNITDMSARDYSDAPNFQTGNPGLKWFTTSISFLVNPNGSPVAGGGISEFQQAAAAWTNVNTSNMSIFFGGTTGFTAQTQPLDSRNVVSYGSLPADNVNCSGEGARTFTRSTSSQFTFINGRRFNRILEADMLINANLTCFLSDPVNLAFVMTHELGHAIGLAGSNLTTAEPGTIPIMREVAFGGRGPTLGMDDVNGISFLYPQPGLNFIDDPRYFVGQQYRDFLNREPDLDGWNFWTGTIVNTCGSDPACISTKKVDVSRAFFYSGEFLSQHPGLRNPDGVFPDFNNAEFVRLCYVVFLRRDVAPDDPGYQFWLNDLNSNNDYNHIIHAFHESSDYRNRAFVLYGFDQ